MAKKQKNKINWPALSTVQFNIVPDSTFNIGSGITTITPNQVSQLWGMPADSYEANRIPYPEKTVVNPHMGQNTIIYNPNTNNRDAVSLDALHVMHDSPIYQELYKQYVESLPQGFEPLMEAANDEFGNEGVTIIEKYQKGLPLSQEEQEVIEPIYDALLRRQFAPDYMKNVPHGYQDKAILPIIPSINMSGDEAIRRYMESYPLKEVTITPENKHGDGGPLHPDWNELSMKDRAAYIRMGVANGYKNIEDIINVYNEFRKGGAKQNPRESYIYEELPTLLKDAGLNVRVTSGYRPVGAVGTAGARSWHPRHGAVDIVPQGDTTFEDIENVLHNHPVVRQYMLSHNLGLLDESGRTPESKETMRRTGATGAHFHIGKDSKPAAAYRQRVGALQSTDDNKVVYFTNPFLPLEQPIESNNVVIDNTPIVPLPVNEAAILSANPYEEEITYEKTLPEVVVRPEPKIVNPQAVYEDMQALAPALTPIEPPTIPSITEKVTALSNARNTFLQNELENSIMRSQLIDDDFSREKLRRDIEDLKFYRNMSAYGGKVNKFEIGGPTDPPVHPVLPSNATMEQAQAYDKAMEEYRRAYQAWKANGGNQKPYTKTYVDSQGRTQTFHRSPKETDEQYEARYNQRMSSTQARAATNQARYQRRQAANAEGAARFNRAANLVTDAMQQSVDSGQQLVQDLHDAAEIQRQQKVQNFHDTADELALGAKAALTGTGIMGGFGTIGSQLGTGLLGGEGVDLTTQVTTPYKNWANMISQTTGLNEGIAELTNPGYFVPWNRIGNMVEDVANYTYKNVYAPWRITKAMGEVKVPKGFNTSVSLMGHNYQYPISTSTKQARVIAEDTYPLYMGPKHSITEVVNLDGTINPRAAMRIQHEVADNIPGAYRMENRLENPIWHVNDPTTFYHTKNVAQSAYSIPTPEGLTKQDQMIAALGHDFGKIISGDGHAKTGAALAEQVFPDITNTQLTAIREHMGTPSTPLGIVTKQADIMNGKLWQQPRMNETPNILLEQESFIPSFLRRNVETTTPITEESILNDLAAAKSYKESPEYQGLVQSFIEETGHPDIPMSVFYDSRKSEIPNVILESRPEGHLGGYKYIDNRLSVDPSQAKADVPFHEGIHWQRIGEVPNVQETSPEYRAWAESFQNKAPEDVQSDLFAAYYNSGQYENLQQQRQAIEDLYKQKVDDVLYEDAVDSELRKPSELAAHTFGTGKALGLKPFQEYPGMQKALEVIEKARKQNSWLWDIKAGTEGEIKKFWKLLTGNYIPSLLIGTSTVGAMSNINNTENEQ